MHPESVMSSPLDLSANATRLPWRERGLRSAVFKRLARLEHGCVTVVDADGVHEFGRASADCPLRAACLSAAIDRAEPWGVWGGEIFDRGVVVARKRPRGRPRKTPVAA